MGHRSFFHVFNLNETEVKVSDSQGSTVDRNELIVGCNIIERNDQTLLKKRWVSPQVIKLKTKKTYSAIHRNGSEGLISLQSAGVAITGECPLHEELTLISNVLTNDKVTLQLTCWLLV